MQPMDLSWNPFSCGGLFMSAPNLVERLRGQQCPLIRHFLTALSVCHTVMVQWKEGELWFCSEVNLSSLVLDFLRLISSFILLLCDESVM